MKIPKILHEIFKEAKNEECHFPQSFIYNEEWMTKLILSTHFKGNYCLPSRARPAQDSTWFSEAQLLSPFLKRTYLEKDKLSEKQTHSDGVIGHIEIRSGTKSGLALKPESSQFIILESKMYSPLSKGVTNAKYYDQAARTVACMAKTIEVANLEIKNLESLGFYVIAPAKQIEKGIFREHMDKKSILNKVEKRIHAYRNDDKHFKNLDNWFESYFQPLLKTIDIECFSWEDSIESIRDDDNRRNLYEFYSLCLKYAK